MSVGDRLGWVGVILALIGIAIAILWPDKKWVGWASLSCAVFLLIVWGWLEVKPQALALGRNYPIRSIVLVFICGGVLASALWLWMTRKQMTPVGGAGEPEKKALAEFRFTFWPIDPNDEKMSDEISLPIINGVVTTTFSAKNTGMAQAENGQIWIQICDGCKFAEEPPGTTIDNPIVRRKRFDVLHMGSYFEGTTLKVIPPVGASYFTIALKYACGYCPPIDNKHPQKLKVNLTPHVVDTALAPSSKRTEALRVIRFIPDVAVNKAISLRIRYVSDGEESIKFIQNIVLSGLRRCRRHQMSKHNKN